MTVAALLAYSAWPVLQLARQHLQSIAVLRVVSDKPVPWLLREVAMEPVHTEEIHFSTSDGVVRARLYIPVRHPRAPGMLVLHGVHYLGMDEPRLMDFASAMSACGLRVLTPEIPGVKDYHVDMASVRVIGNSAQWFHQQTGAPVGVMGLSFSGGLALVAASEPQFNKNFKFIFTVGADDAMQHVATFYRTGEEIRPNGTVEVLKPHDYGTLVLEYEHPEDFMALSDESSIRPVLRDHLYENWPAEKADLARLTTVQHNKAMQLMNASAPLTITALASDETRHLADMALVSPHGRLSRMTTPVYLLHGAGDNIIPSAEALWLAKELPKATLRKLLISPVISHVDIREAQPRARDKWNLVHFFALVLHEAERN